MNENTPLAPDPERLSHKLASSDRPYLTLKVAATLDGRIATRSGESRWITGEAARHHGHRLRAGHEGILVGMGTVISDDPRLTVRLGGSPEGGAFSPVRIVLDSRARIDPSARLLNGDGARRIVITGAEAKPPPLERLRKLGVEVMVCRTPRPEATEFLPRLRELGISSLLVEGGGSVHSSLIALKEADELFLYLAGRLIGDGGAPAWCDGLGVERLEDTPRLILSPPAAIGEDVLVHGFFD